MQKWQEFGFLEKPTEREIGVRQALYVQPAADPRVWALKNIAVLRRRSLRGAYAVYVSQFDTTDERRAALCDHANIREIFHGIREEHLAPERLARETAPLPEFAHHLSDYRRRFFELLWKNRGTPLSYAMINRSCSESKDDARRDSCDPRVLGDARDTMRKILHDTGAGVLFTIQDTGVMFLDTESSGLPLSALENISRNRNGGIYGLNFHIVNQQRPETTPYDMLFDAHAALGRRAGETRDSQQLASSVPDLNKYSGDPPLYVVQSTFNEGYRLYTWNELPLSWLRAIKQSQLLSKETDFLVHFLSRLGKTITTEEALALMGKPGQTEPDSSNSQRLIKRFFERVHSMLPVESLHIGRFSNSRLLGYRASIPADLIAHPHPQYERYLKMVAGNVVLPDAAMDTQFAAFNPSAFDEIYEALPVESDMPFFAAEAPLIRIPEEGSEESSDTIPDSTLSVPATAQSDAIETTKISLDPDAFAPSDCAVAYAREHGEPVDDREWLDERMSAELLHASDAPDSLRIVREYLHNWDGKGSAGFHLCQRASIDVVLQAAASPLQTQEEVLEILRMLICTYGHDPAHPGTWHLLARLTEYMTVSEECALETRSLITRLWENDIGRQNIAAVVQLHPASAVSSILCSAIPVEQIGEITVLSFDERWELGAEDDVVIEQSPESEPQIDPSAKKSGSSSGKERTTKILDPEQMLHVEDGDHSNEPASDFDHHAESADDFDDE